MDSFNPKVMLDVSSSLKKLLYKARIYNYNESLKP